MTSQIPEAASVAEAEAAASLAGVAPVGVSDDSVSALQQEVQASKDWYDERKGVKALLPPGAFMTDDHRYYFNGEGPVPSVTTVLEVLSKPALVEWKAREAVRAYIRNRSTLDKILMDQNGGEDAAIREALKLVDGVRDKAAGIGSSVHLLADIVARGAETATDGFRPSDEEIPYLNAWRCFLTFLEAQGGNENAPARIVSSEHAVWSQNGYAGTYDLILEMGGQLWLVDIKTSKGYYPEYGLQLAGYRWADWIILQGDPNPYPMPEIHRTAVLHLRPEQYKEGWRLIEYPTTYEADYLTFLGALEILKWRKAGRFSKRALAAI